MVICLFLFLLLFHCCFCLSAQSHLLVVVSLSWPLALFTIAAHLLICCSLFLLLFHCCFVQSLSFCSVPSACCCLTCLASCSVYHIAAHLLLCCSLFISLSLTLSLLFCVVFVFLLMQSHLLVVASLAWPLALFTIAAHLLLSFSYL